MKGRVSKVLVPAGKQGTGRVLVTFPFAGGKGGNKRPRRHFPSYLFRFCSEQVDARTVCDALLAQTDVFKDWHHFFDTLGLGVLNVQYRGRFPEGSEDVVLHDAEEVAAEITTALEAELKVRSARFAGPILRSYHVE
jgi:hypothetical protein